MFTDPLRLLESHFQSANCPPFPNPNFLTLTNNGGENELQVARLFLTLILEACQIALNRLILSNKSLE
jgi:hypothetical protein